MTLETLLRIFSDKGCKRVYVKRLAANDNSKNQIYLAGSFDVLNIIPSGQITKSDDSKKKNETLKSSVKFFWIDDDGSGTSFLAPNAQLILYPDYPEVRFSGFLKNCKKAPSHLLTKRLHGRILLLGVNESREVYGFVAENESQIANEFNSLKGLETHVVFSVITLSDGKILGNSKDLLLRELKRIHSLGWICSKRLNSNRQIVACNSSNCGGYTLEAELNIPSNSNAEPDFYGWEIKQFRVANFNKFGSSPITLMDHSPTDGYFSSMGTEAFIRKYGYNDKKGRLSRMNFGGTHKYNVLHRLTSLRLVINGFDVVKKVITNPDGYVALIDSQENLAAAWSFTSIINHWKTKHPQACYVPSLMRKGAFQNCSQQYSFGNKIILGNYTNVYLFLYELSIGSIYYDPGIKLELAIEGERNKTIKVRSLFRTRPVNIPSLYFNTEIVDLKE